MFAARPDLSAVKTTAGWLTRDGLVDGQPYREAIAEPNEALPGMSLFEELPTLAEAWAIFRERPDCWAIVTEQGRLLRDGTLTFPRWS